LLPAIPGPAVGYLWMVLLHFSNYHAFSANTVIIWWLVVITLSILDYVIPTLGVKKFWWTKRWNMWSMIWMFVAVWILPIFGIVLGPFGLLWLIAGPFLGAYIWESMGGRDHEKALRAAVGSFIWFITGTLLNIWVAITIFVSILIELIKIWSA
jgi:hypothetical protein